MGNIEETPSDPREKLRNFVVESKVDAFCSVYEPAEEESASDDMFTDERLRKYFAAYPRSEGDPLCIYVDELLRPRGYIMQHSLVLCEPVIFVRERKNPLH